jgi:hypothetical protein
MADASSDTSDGSELEVVTPRPLAAEDDAPMLPEVQEVRTAQEASRDDAAAIATEEEQEEEEEEEDDDGDEGEDDDEEGEEDEEDDEDEEPQLKYARLTKHLGSVYRNGDATSAFLVAGDKMVSLRAMSDL